MIVKGTEGVPEQNYAVAAVVTEASQTSGAAVPDTLQINIQLQVTKLAGRDEQPIQDKANKWKAACKQEQAEHVKTKELAANLERQNKELLEKLARLEQDKKDQKTMQEEKQKAHVAHLIFFPVPTKIEKSDLDLFKKVVELQKLVANFDANYQQIMKLTAESLTDLAKRKDYESASFSYFPGLTSYLAKPAYSYVFDNVHLATSKLRKAGPMYLIRGMESKNPEIRGEAYKAFNAVLKNYLLNGQNTPQKDGILKVLTAVSKGFYNAETNKAYAIQTLAKAWETDAEKVKAIIS